MRFNQKKTSIIVLLFVASLLVVLPIQMVKAQTSTTTVTVTPQTSTPVVGQTITINIQLNNVQNLYAFDVILDYDSSVLQLVNSKVDLGTSSIPGGVLYGSPVTDDENNIDPGVVYYNTSLSTVGEYYLFANSVNPASAFSGNGTIATLTFTVTSAGQSSLTLNSTLANYPATGETSEPIAHNDISGTVDATASSSSPSTSPTPSSSSSSSPSSPSSSPSSSSSPSPSLLKSTTFPELLAIIVVVVIVLVSVAVLLSRKMVKKTAPTSS